MIRRHGLATTATTMTGSSRFAFGDGPESATGRFPPLNAVALGDLFDRLYETITPVRTDAPWLTPDAQRLDRLTGADWLGDVHDHARRFFPTHLGHVTKVSRLRGSSSVLVRGMRNRGSMRGAPPSSSPCARMRSARP